MTLCDLSVADFRVTLAKVAAAGGCDLVLTSPPYDDARDYGAGVSWTFSDYQALGDAVAPALKPGGHALIVLDSPVRDWRPGFGSERGFTPWKVMLDWAERVGFRVPDRLAYARYGSAGAYANRFRNDWEPLLWFQRTGADGYFDKWPLAEWGVMTGAYASNRKTDGTVSVRSVTGRAAEEGLKHRGTLWDYANGTRSDPKAPDHPARFSIRLAEDVVQCFCPPGGLVCDPMVGSGTTAVAAIKQGRRFVGGDAYNDDAGRPWAHVAQDEVERVITMFDRRT